MISEERSDLLQQYLVALTSYFEAHTNADDPKVLDELRSDVEKASTLLGDEE